MDVVGSASAIVRIGISHPRVVILTFPGPLVGLGILSKFYLPTFPLTNPLTLNGFHPLATRHLKKDAIG